METFWILFVSGILVSILSLLLSDGKKPNGAFRFLCSLFLIFVLLSPLSSLLSSLSSLPDFLEDGSEVLEKRYREEASGYADQASREWTASALSSLLERDFSIPSGELRVVMEWTEGGRSPSRVVLILSGSAKWKNPAPMEDYVRNLLNCECVSAVE